MNSKDKYNLLALLLAGLFIFSLPSCTSKNVSFKNKILIRVNDSELSAKDFASQLAERLRGFDSLTVKNSKTVQQIKNAVAQEFIVRSISLKWAKDNNIFVKKEELEAEIDLTRGYYPDDLAFRRALSNEKISYEEWRQRLSFSLLEKKILKALKDRVSVPSEKELKSYYENNKDEFKRAAQIKLSQIVLSTENDAKRVRAELRKGKKFDSMAKNFSIAPEAEKAGLIGWIEKGTLGIFDKAFALRAGQTSLVEKSPYGFHILKVLAKRAPKILSFKEARSNILRKQMAKREQAAYSSWLENQVRQTKIFKDEELIKSLSVETRNE